MLLSHKLIRFIRLNVKTLHLIGSYPISINFENNQLSFSKQDGLMKQNLKHFGFIVFVIISFVQIIYYKPKFSEGVIFESIFFTFAVPPLVLAHDVYMRRGKLVVELFNLILTFEQKLITGN